VGDNSGHTCGQTGLTGLSRDLSIFSDKMIFMDAFDAKEVADLRSAKSWTRGDLALNANVNVQDLFHWETGVGTPTEREAGRLAQALGVPLVNLYFEVPKSGIPL